MKCAKSLNTKYSASFSASGGTGVLPACRAASSATMRGEAEPTWWTWSSAFGRPLMKSDSVVMLLDSDIPVSTLRRSFRGAPQNASQGPSADRPEVVHRLEHGAQALQCFQCFVRTVRVGALVQLDTDEPGADGPGQGARIDDKGERAVAQQPADHRLY